MKYVKCISLFIVYPLLVLGLGFYAGVRSSHYFYPERESREEQEDFFETSMDEGAQGGQASELTGESLAAKDEAGQKAEDELLPVLPEETDMGQAQEVMVSAETLCVDTKYVLEETDILYHTVVETTPPRLLPKAPLKGSSRSLSRQSLAHRREAMADRCTSI